MSNILTLLTGGIIDYLLLASLLAAVLTLLVVSFIKVAGIRNPIYCHMIWLYALIGIVVFPAVWLYGPMLTFEILPAEDQSTEAISSEMESRYQTKLAKVSPTEIHSPESISAETSVTEHAILPRPFPVKTILAGLWFYGTILMSIRLLISWFRLYRICLSAESIYGKSRLENKYDGKFKLLLSSQVNGPVCFGVWQPGIILPREMYDTATPEDFRMAMNHEYAHIERNDCLTNLLQRIIESIFFFNPFVWYASFQLTQQREQICDNYVIYKGAHIMEYSKFLSRIADQKFEKRLFQAVALFEGRLLQRVRSLLDPRRSNQIKASRWAIIFGVIAMMACLIFGIVRLEAKSNSDLDSTKSPVKKYSVVPQRETYRTGRPKGNCSISGKVISAESGKPVAHAKVYLFYLKTHTPIFIEVAGDGTFVFKDIPTGPFSLRTTGTTGFQDAIYNPEKKPGSYPEFSLTDKEQRTDVVLEVKPACSIAGKIYDENGEPPRYGKLWVYAWIESDEPGSNLNRYRIAGQTRVESDGSFSLDGLDSRPIYVMAIDLRSDEKDEFYPPCYYPGTVDRNKAKKVSFDDTKSVKEVNIRLQKKGEFILEGVVTDEKTGNPIPKALVTVHRRDMLFDRVTAYTDEQGSYRIESLGAGEFLVHVDAKPWGFVRIRKPVEVKDAAKTTVLDFTLRSGASISGKFVDENGTPVEISQRAYGSAYRYDKPAKGSWTGTRNRHRAKGRMTVSFFLEGEGDYENESMDFPTPSSFITEGLIPGKTVLRFYPKTKGQTVKEILYNGNNIMETGIDTKPGQEIKDVMIVIKSVS